MRTELTEIEQEALSALLHERVFPGLSRDDLKAEFNIHLNHRLTEARNNLVPWLAQFIELDSARVLEVGAGTGSSVIGFAEVCRHVDAVDILDAHLDVTRARVTMHGLDNVSVYCRNATAELSEIADSPYDLIV